MTEKPVCVLFDTKNHFYCFDAGRNYVMEVSQSNYHHLQNLMESDAFYDDAKQIEDPGFKVFFDKAMEKGFFTRERIKRIEHQLTNMVENLVKKNCGHLILQTTQKCNLRCEYCPYSGNLYNARLHTNKAMSWEIAKQAVDFFLEHSADTDTIAIGFYGGEPLLELQLLEKVVEYVKSKKLRKEVYFLITTNATLLVGEAADFLAEHEVTLTVSLDGPKEAHDKYRRFVSGQGSFGTVMKNLALLKEKHPDYFKKCVSFSSVVTYDQDVGAVNEFFCDGIITKDMPTMPSLVAENDMKDDVIVKQSDIFLESMRNEKLRGILSKLGKATPPKGGFFPHHFDLIKQINQTLVATKSFQKKGHPGGPCVPGVRKLFVSVEGKLFPCEKVNEVDLSLCIGDIYTGFDVKQVQKVLNVGWKTEEDCINCWAFNNCYVCCINKNDGKECESVRRNLLENYREYCLYRERGYDFETGCCAQ